MAPTPPEDVTQVLHDIRTPAAGRSHRLSPRRHPALAAHLIHARDSDGSTPLHCAAWKGHQAVVAFLLSVGADVNAQNNNEHWGTTPLHAAAHANQALIAQMLIEHSADVNAKDMGGNTPLHHTTFHKAKAAAKVLQEQMLKS